MEERESASSSDCSSSTDTNSEPDDEEETGADKGEDHLEDWVTWLVRTTGMAEDGKKLWWKAR